MTELRQLQLVHLVSCVVCLSVCESFVCVSVFVSECIVSKFVCRNILGFFLKTQDVRMEIRVASPPAFWLSNLKVFSYRSRSEIDNSKPCSSSTGVFPKYAYSVVASSQIKD